MPSLTRVTLEKCARLETENRRRFWMEKEPPTAMTCTVLSRLYPDLHYIIFSRLNGKPMVHTRTHIQSKRASSSMLDRAGIRRQTKRWPSRAGFAKMINNPNSYCIIFVTKDNTKKNQH